MSQNVTPTTAIPYPEVRPKAKGLAQLSNTKKLKGDDRYYRIKLGDYRIGIIIEDDVVTFGRIEFKAISCPSS
jgi:mRNA-degrading endonuclease RelE of RelBE toxin-antitoxin system